MCNFISRAGERADTKKQYKRLYYLEHRVFECRRILDPQHLTDILHKPQTVLEAIFHNVVLPCQCLHLGHRHVGGAAYTLAFNCSSEIGPVAWHEALRMWEQFFVNTDDFNISDLKKKKQISFISYYEAEYPLHLSVVSDVVIWGTRPERCHLWY